MDLPENAPDFRFDELHPLVADGMVVTSREIFGDEVAYQIDFRRPLGGVAVAHALHDPLWPVGDGARVADVTRGLRSLTYPNSRLSRMVRRAHHEDVTEAHRYEIRGEAAELAAHIETAAAAQPTVQRFELPVYDGDSVREAVKDDIRAIKPLELKTVAATAGVIVDDLMVRRLRQPRSRQRAPLIDDYLASMSASDRDQLFDVVQDKGYFTVDAQDEEGQKRTVSLRRADLPRFFRTDRVEAVRLGPVLQASVDNRIPIRPVIMRLQPDKMPSAAYAQLRWLTKADGSRELLFDGGSRQWSKLREQLDRTSAVLGPVLLAATADVDYGQPLRQIWRRTGRKGRRPYHERRQPMPRTLAGVLPLLLRHQEDTLLSQSYIVAAEAAIDDQQADRAIW